MNLKSIAQSLRDIADAIEEDEVPAKPAPKKKPAPPADDDEDEATGLDYLTEVKPLVVKLSKDHGRDVALEVLEKFENAKGEPCTKGAEVLPEDYEKLLKAIARKNKELADD